MPGTVARCSLQWLRSPSHNVRSERAGDLVRGEDGRERVGLARQRGAGRLLGPVEGDDVEEPQRAHDRADAGGLEAAGDQVELVVANVLQGELVRRAAVEGAEVGDRAHVAPAGAGAMLRSRM